MPPVTSIPTLTPRGLSTDNTLNIIFGVLATVLGLLSVLLTWAVRRSSPWTVVRHGYEENCTAPSTWAGDVG